MVGSILDGIKKGVDDLREGTTDAFNRACYGHSPGTWDMVVSLGEPVLGSDGQASNDVYAYCAQLTSSGSVRGEIREMRAEYFDQDGEYGVSNCYTLKGLDADGFVDLKNQIDGAARDVCRKALALDGVAPGYGRVNDLTGTRAEIRSTFDGLETRIGELEEEYARLPDDALRVTEPHRNMQDLLQSAANVMDHSEAFGADMMQKVMESDLGIKDTAPVADQKSTLNMTFSNN